MAKQKVSITDNGIKSGVTSDEKRAICEYIWNGFDAKATCVELVYEYNELGYIQYFAIKDRITNELKKKLLTEIEYE